MSWRQIPNGRHKTNLGVTMALRLGAGNHADNRMIFVYLGSDVLEKLQWDATIKVGVYAGEGEHKDKMRIARAANDAMKIRSVGGASKRLAVVFLPPAYVSVEQSQKAVPVEYEIVAGGIELVPPAWARPTSVSPLLKPPVMRDVTSAIMGDPATPRVPLDGGRRRSNQDR